MAFYNKIHGEYEHDFKVGDKILWEGMELTVGNDWEELYRWRPYDGTKTHIVTTCGRVLDIKFITKIEENL